MTQRHPARRAATLIAGVSIVALASPSLAQDTAPDSSDGEIIVTATKRAEALEDVPIAVSVITGEELEERNTQGFQDYLTSVPGVQFNYGGNQYTNSISIRGVTDLSGSALTQTPVAIYLDEAPLTLSQGSFNLDYSVFGVEQINVIKGPHSTLYGAASLGGTIKVVTRKPSLEGTRYFANAGLYSIHDGGVGGNIAASISTPLVENRVGLEVTGYYQRHAGFIDHPFRNETDINDGQTYGARVALRIKPSERLTVDATVYYQKHKKNGLDTFAPNQVGDLDSRPLTTPQSERDRFWMGSLVIDYDLDFANVVSATSYYERKSNVSTDLSQSFFNLGIPGATVTSVLNTPTKVWSEEIRLGSGPNNWIPNLLGI